jgi:hypothetical protein
MNEPWHLKLLEDLKRQEEKKLKIEPNTDALDFIMTLPEDTEVDLRDDWSEWITGGSTTRPAMRYLKTFYPDGTPILRVYRWDNGSYDVYI